MTMKKMLVAMLCVCFLALSATAGDVENFDDAGDTLQQGIIRPIEVCLL